MESEKTIDQVYDEYALALNNHADQCPTCDAARKTGVTTDVCEEGRKLVDQWKTFMESKREEIFGKIERLTVKGRKQ